MMHRHAAALLVLVAASLACPADAEFKDVLDTPAMMSPLANSTLLLGIARAGDRLVSVGVRGHIVWSDDGGANWTQAAVPVSSDLTAVYFATPQSGWAVGHDGIVLASNDGGKSWVKQLDGIKAAQIMADFYHDGELHDDAQRMVADGPDKPFLDVWFADDKNGFVIGAFNLAFRTRDGGQNWEPIYHRIENPQRLHLYGIRPFGDALFIVGEAGLVLRSEHGGDFKRVALPYQGSLFGLATGKSALLVYGLRGNLFRSEDRGASWAKVDLGERSALVGSTGDGAGEIAIVAQSGTLYRSEDDGKSFKAFPQARPMPLSGVTENAQGGLILIGFAGSRPDAAK
jgi:photosystem II stability/assembly factor-like uncharacterized protein